MLLLLLGTACSSGGIGDVLGGGSSRPTSYEIRGVVDSVDTYNRSVYLRNVSGYQSMLSGGSSNSEVRVYFDDQTTVDYQGRSYRPEDLERGDEVTVRVDESSNRLVADRVTVNYDVSSGGTSSSSGSSSQISTVRGTVRYIDTSRHTIELESVNWYSGFNRGTTTGSTVIISYDTGTNVDVSGQSYPVTNLERGDIVDVQVHPLGSTSYLADRITLIRDVNR
ncbi:MAG TPA: DUF5666 domain-containing protein [Thermoanaerobaculia bacterium]|nr:DUF5666 domain-containing protein [Thermoanaerobaculia bacterium]